MLLTRWRERRPDHFIYTAALVFAEAFANARSSGSVKKNNTRIWDCVINSITMLLLGATLIAGMVIIWAEIIVVTGFYLLLILIS